MSARIGPRMRGAVWAVAPGCTLRHVVRGMSYHGGVSYQYAYAAITRAIRAGLIENRGTAARFALYVTPAGRAVVWDEAAA